jgi:DNA adenine methylase
MNKMEGMHYAEPFAGGAGIALELLFSELVSKIHINDIDLSIYAFWHSAVHQTDALIERIKKVDVSVENWLAARETKRNASSSNLLDLGFATFFLNRTNKSGILNGGIIGGLNQTGDYKIDCRFNKAELIRRIQRIGFYKSRISIQNLDATKFMTDHVSPLGEACLLYIDPPYYIKGAYLYQNHFDHDDHLRLRNFIEALRGPKWLVSYDNVDSINQIYERYEKEPFDISYSARTYSKGKEVMIFCDGLLRPKKIYSTLKEKRILEATQNL